MKRIIAVVVLVAAGLPVALVQTAAALPAGFSVTTVFSGLSTPTAVRFASDGRVFVAEKSGIIKVFDDMSDTSPTVFADLSTNVYNYYDRGLLGLELHPQFPAVPYVYALYTHDAEIGGTAPRWGTPGVLSDPCPDPPGASTNGCVVSGRLSRLEAAGNVMSGTEHVLVEDWCQQFPSHSIGTVAFGPDGALYVGAGDGALAADWGQRGDPVNPCGDPPGGVGGVMEPPTAEGGALRSQDMRTTSDPAGLDGTIIRIDPDTGEAMPGNPFAGSSDPNARRIIAYGLRNPFRWAFRPGSSEIFVADVGQNRWEEINRIADATDGVAENFGWPCYEGDVRFPTFDNRDFTICEEMYGTPATTPTWFTYQHNVDVYPGDPCGESGGVISAIEFYREGAYPDSYDGALFFADYSRRCIWAIPEAPNGQFDMNAVHNFAYQNVGYPVDLEVGPGGDVFYVDISGSIKRIQYFGTNQPPEATISATPQSGPVPLTVSFDGTGSRDPEGQALVYEWDLDGDGAYDDSTGATAGYTYETAADYTVRLRVTDPEGATGTASIVISAGNEAPTATILSPSASLSWQVGESISFSGEATDPEDGTLPASALDWSLVLHHCPEDNCHEHHIQDFAGQASGSFAADDHEYPSHLELELTATDSRGLSSSTSVLLYPETVDITLESAPSGLQLDIGSMQGTTPFTAPAIVGSTLSLTAPSPQYLAGNPYEFVSWSDGGAQSHDILVTEPATYTATFREAELVVDVAITDGGYNPKDVDVLLPQMVRWTNTGTTQQSVTDSSRMNLYDSGPLAPGASFTFEYFAAGRYAYGSTLSKIRGSVSVPMLVSPASGAVTAPVDLTWAASAPADFVFDVQVQRPGSTSWVNLRYGETATGASFVPDAGVGTYQFRARLRRISSGRNSAYSPPVSYSATANEPPVAEIQASPISGDAPLTVDFDGSASSDPEGGALTYEWDLDGDGAYDEATDPVATYTYDAPGSYTVRLRVTDSEGASATSSVVITVGSASSNAAPSPVILTPEDTTTWHVGESIAFAGEATDTEDGTLPSSALDWEIILHHCPDGLCHEHPVQSFTGQDTGSFAAPDHTYPSHLELRLTATDSSGASTTTNLYLYPETVEVTIDSSPTGLQLYFDAAAGTAPFTRTAIVGSTVSISAPSPQNLGSATYEFSSWSDGGEQTHDIVAGTASGTYVATFAESTSSLVDVTITDSGYTPKDSEVGLPQVVRWTNTGSNAHTVTDSTGMQMYDSGSLAPAGNFSFEFFAAGRYTFRSTIDDSNFRGSASVPIASSAASGPASIGVDLTWAASAPSGYVFDVQIMRPGSGSWSNWSYGTTATGSTFVPDAGPGDYQFRARLRRPSTSRNSAYSVPLVYTAT